MPSSNYLQKVTQQVDLFVVKVGACPLSHVL